MHDNHWFVYILRCSDNTLYTGVTCDLEKRLHQHNHGSKGAKYTRARRPVELVYQEKAPNRSVAQQREYHLRHLNTAQKRELIRQGNPLA